MDKPYTRCTYDVVFKFLLMRQLQLVYEIINGATGIKCKEMTIMNPNILPNSNDKKNMQCDILAKNELGYFFDIEMQNSRITIPLSQRIQFYASRMIALQTKAGQPYNLKPAYCIVLINQGSRYTQLVETHVLGNENWVMKGNLIHITFVYLPYINTLAKQKGLRKLNTFERIIYVFHNNLSCDILELGDEVINTMAENKNAFYLNDGGLLTLAERKWWDAYIEQEREKEMQRMEKRSKELEEQSRQFEAKSKQFEAKSKQFEAKSKQFEEKSKQFEEQSKQFQEENMQLTKKFNQAIEIAMKKLNLSYNEAITFLTTE